MVQCYIHTSTLWLILRDGWWVWVWLYLRVTITPSGRYNKVSVGCPDSTSSYLGLRYLTLLINSNNLSHLIKLENNWVNIRTVISWYLWPLVVRRGYFNIYLIWVGPGRVGLGCDWRKPTLGRHNWVKVIDNNKLPFQRIWLTIWLTQYRQWPRPHHTTTTSSPPISHNESSWFQESWPVELKGSRCGLITTKDYLIIIIIVPIIKRNISKNKR